MPCTTNTSCVNGYPTSLGGFAPGRRLLIIRDSLSALGIRRGLVDDANLEGRVLEVDTL